MEANGPPPPPPPPPPHVCDLTLCDTVRDNVWPCAAAGGRGGEMGWGIKRKSPPTQADMRL